VVPGELSPGLDAAITLPNSLFEALNSHAGSSLVFARYNESTLFPVDEGRNSMNSSTRVRRQTVIDTDILAATVVGEVLTDLDEDKNVTIIFQPKIPDGKVQLLHL
jgi:antitoxin component of MazEF toxin-antitoxin module